MIGATGRSNWPSHNPDFFNASGTILTAGMIVEIDFLAQNTLSAPSTAQAAAGVQGVDLQTDNVQIPTAAGIFSCVAYAVVIDPTIAVNTRGKFCLRGFATVNTFDAVNIGDNLIPVAGQTFLSVNHSKGPFLSVAKAIQAQATPNIASQILAWFDGFPARMNQGSV